MKYIIAIFIFSFSSSFLSAQTAEQKKKMSEDVKRYHAQMGINIDSFSKALIVQDSLKQHRIETYLKKTGKERCSKELDACIADIIDGIPIYEGNYEEISEIEMIDSLKQYRVKAYLKKTGEKRCSQKLNACIADVVDGKPIYVTNVNGVIWEED